MPSDAWILIQRIENRAHTDFQCKVTLLETRQ